MAPRAKYAYVVSAPGGPFVFLEHPSIRGLWIRTHASVAVVECAYCRADVLEPCRDRNGEHKSATHWVRRRDGRYAFSSVSSKVITILKRGSK